MAMSRSAALTPEEISGALGDYDEADAPIIDGHNHVILPAEQHVAHLDEAGVSRAVLLVARPHPERANNTRLEREMAALNQTVSGAQNAGDSIRPAMAQLHESISLYPDRFVGFGQVPLNAPATDLRAWVQTEIIERGLRGIGEISVPPGRAALLEPVLRAASDYNGRLPVLVHAFAPQTIDDIRTFATLAAAYPSVPLILGQLGGLNWLDAIEIVKGAASTLLPRSGDADRVVRTLFSGSGNSSATPVCFQCAVQRTGRRSLRYRASDRESQCRRGVARQNHGRALSLNSGKSGDSGGEAANAPSNARHWRGCAPPRAENHTPVTARPGDRFRRNCRSRRAIS